MKTKFENIFIATLLATSVVGCTDKPNISTPVEWSYAAVKSIGDKENYFHCAAALAPHQGSDTIDESIIRLQSKAETSGQYLERLGWAFIAKARSSFDPGYYNLAEQSALCLKERHQNDHGALLLWGHALHQQHQFSEAEAIARELTQKRGNWSDFALLGDVLMEQGALDDATVAYQNMMNQKPGPETYVRAAHMRWLKGDIDGAIELTKMAVSNGGGNSETAAWLRHRLAVYEYSRGNLDLAKQLLRSALQIFPTHAPSFYQLGQISLFENDADLAVELMTQANQFNPTPEYSWGLIEALRLAGNETRARAEETALHTNGQNEDQRTYALFLASNSDESENLRKSLALAVKEIKKRQDIFTQDVYAWSLWRNGDSETAYEVIQQALSHGTQDARLYLHAGTIAAGVGDAVNANKWLTQAKQLNYTLWPSERQQLAKEFAALKPQSRPSV